MSPFTPTPTSGSSPNNTPNGGNHTNFPNTTPMMPSQRNRPTHNRSMGARRQRQMQPQACPPEPEFLRYVEVNKGRIDDLTTAVKAQYHRVEELYIEDNRTKLLVEAIRSRTEDHIDDLYTKLTRSVDWTTHRIMAGEKDDEQLRDALEARCKHIEGDAETYRQAADAKIRELEDRAAKQESEKAAQSEQIRVLTGKLDDLTETFLRERRSNNDRVDELEFRLTGHIFDNHVLKTYIRDHIDALRAQLALTPESQESLEVERGSEEEPPEGQ